MPRLPVAQQNAAVAAAFVPATGYFLTLNTADPGTTGAGEVNGGAYTRQAIAFGAPSAGSEASTSAQSFPNMPAVTATHFGINTAGGASGGTYMGGGQLASSLTVPAGATVAFAIGAVTAAIS